ncbi:MAG TPA: hypothetical protein VGG88_05035 [Gaiellaceae bacterium]
MAVVVLAAGIAVVLWGGYERHWSWTGMQHHPALWDWLNILLLPVALALTPLWLRHAHAIRGTHHAILAACAAAFGILVLLGYLIPLRWTGFPGNTLWDWLNLLVLPLTVALLPIWVEVAREIRARHLAVAGFAVAVLVVTAIGGYLYDWRWTGFVGNSLFDWFRLLVGPLAIPLVAIPIASRWLVSPTSSTR